MATDHSGKQVRNCAGLILYLAGGWRTYQEIAREFGWAIDTHGCRTASRNVRALEQAGLPVEWYHPPDERVGSGQKMRLPPDWVARCPWLHRYIIRKEVGVHVTEVTTWPKEFSK